MKKISIAILALVIIMVACKKTPEVNLEYVDVERDLITVGTNTATIQCDYQYIATLKKAYLYYGEGEDATDMTSAEMRVVQNTLCVDLTGLKENTTYSYYYEFVNGFNSMQTEVKTFRTGIALPVVVTVAVLEITDNSAQCGGEVVKDGGAVETERGVCWSLNENPSLNDNHVRVGSGIGSFSTIVSGLKANTLYHVRAYATNEAGTVYGEDESFMTLAPAGAIRGLFTVNSNGDQVYFSQGNLQYQASTNTWRFAEHQWDYVGGVDTITGELCGNVYDNGIKSDNALISPTYNGWIDLYGWSSNGHDHGAVCYQPWSTSGDFNDYHAYGGFSYSLYDQTGQAEWGYNAISNGGNAENNGWRTPTWNEWHYVFFSRATVSDIRFAKGIVNDVMGVILLPDEWDVSIYALNNVNQEYASFASNVITLSDWEEFLEVNGVAFLPAAGIRYLSAYYNCGYGHYWSSSSFNDEIGAYDLDFGDNFLETDYYGSRYYGHMVRLVIDNNP